MNINLLYKMELTYDQLIPNTYYYVLYEKFIYKNLFLGISDEKFVIFDGTNNSRFHCNPLYYKFYNTNPTPLIISTKILIIGPNEYDPITFDSIEDGDIIILINNDKRFMFKENTFKNHIVSKNPFTNEKLNQNNIIKYIAVIMPNVL
jgi:hypothetical protein